MSEFDAWSGEVRALLSRKGIEAPSEENMAIMYDDGLDPEDLLDEEVRRRYEAQRHRTVTSNVADILAEFRKD